MRSVSRVVTVHGRAAEEESFFILADAMIDTEAVHLKPPP